MCVVGRLSSFVRLDDELPKLASMKIDKTKLRREAWTGADVLWRPPGKGQPLRSLGAGDRHRLDHLLAQRDRTSSP